MAQVRSFEWMGVRESQEGASCWLRSWCEAGRAGLSSLERKANSGTAGKREDREVTLAMVVVWSGRQNMDTPK